MKGPISNQSKYLAPRARIVQSFGTEVSCDVLMSPQYRIDGDWYSIRNPVHLVPAPVELNPTPLKTWKSSPQTLVGEATQYHDEPI